MGIKIYQNRSSTNIRQRSSSSSGYGSSITIIPKCGEEAKDHEYIDMGIMQLVSDPNIKVHVQSYYENGVFIKYIGTYLDGSGTVVDPLSLPAVQSIPDDIDYEKVEYCRIVTVAGTGYAVGDKIKVVEYINTTTQTSVGYTYTNATTMTSVDASVIANSQECTKAVQRIKLGDALFSVDTVTGFVNIPTGTTHVEYQFKGGDVYVRTGGDPDPDNSITVEEGAFDEISDINEIQQKRFLGVQTGAKIYAEYYNIPDTVF